MRVLFLDVNVCLYAFRPTMSDQAAAVADWLGARLSGRDRVAVSDSVLASMVRIATHPRVFEEPAPPATALDFAATLRSHPSVGVVTPGAQTWQAFTEYVADLRLKGADVPEAYLAAVARGSGATMVTTDRGFTRFPGLRVLDPTTA